MKNLLLGISFLVLVGFGGFFYRNAIEYSKQPIGCPVTPRVCPDGTTVSRVAPSCTYAPCLPPNITIEEIGVAFALPENFTKVESADSSVVVSYESPSVSPAEKGSVMIRRYAIVASTTALDTIQQTSIGATSGLPVGITNFTSTTLGVYRFTVVNIDRFEGVVYTAYYLARGTDVLRFDAIDRGVDWTNPSLDVITLPTQAALRQLLSTLQGE